MIISFKYFKEEEIFSEVYWGRRLKKENIRLNIGKIFSIVLHLPLEAEDDLFLWPLLYYEMFSILGDHTILTHFSPTCHILCALKGQET